MTTIRKTITLSDTQDAWIKAQIARGAFTNDSEYTPRPRLRAAISSCGAGTRPGVQQSSPKTGTGSFPRTEIPGADF